MTRLIRKTKLATRNKYRAQSQSYGDRKYHSKMEAGFAYILDMLHRAGEIEKWEPQFMVEMVAHDSHGVPRMRMKHAVDFRVTTLDGKYELLEIKGFPTKDWALRKRWLENLFLPENPDHTYRVLYKGDKYRGCQV